MPGELSRRLSSDLAPNPQIFFLSGYYGQGNLGDDLLLRATIDGLCRVIPARRFVIRNQGRVAGLKGVVVPVELTGIDRIAADQTKSKFSRLVLTLLAYRRHLKQCDWFVFGGGTVFHERSSILPLVTTFLVCLLARISGVRIAALGVGVAAIRSTPGSFLLRLIIGLSDVFAVRDDAAAAECARAGAGRRIVLTADLVFTTAKSLRNARQKSSQAVAPLIGVSVYAPVLSGADGDRVSAIMCDALQMILSRGWNVELLAFHHRPGADIPTDTAVLARLAKNLPDQYQDQVMQRVLDADDVAGIAAAFSELDVHCGMRFHGHVLSAIFEKPFVGIAVDNKIDAICRLFGMPVVQLNRLSSEDIVKAIDQAMASSIDPLELARCEENAAKNFSQLLLSMQHSTAAG